MGLRDCLAGSTFELVSVGTRSSDGEVIRPFGERPVGTFLFDRADRFSVQLTDPVAHSDSTAYTAMFGTYDVDDSAETFTLTVDGALDPTMIGGKMVRHVAFNGGVAVFSTDPVQHDGMSTTTYITWRMVWPR